MTHRGPFPSLPFSDNRLLHLCLQGSVLLIREVKYAVKQYITALNFLCWSFCKRALARGAEVFVPTSPAGEILMGVRPGCRNPAVPMHLCLCP